MDALILVDLQNDFLPGGALGVPTGAEVLPLAVQLMTRFELVIATQDWHPANHVSFAAHHAGRKPFEQIDLGGHLQTLWPIHCVQGTPGAELAEDLPRQRISKIIQKGTDPQLDSYSGFYDDRHLRSTGLTAYLHEVGATHLYVLGLTTDYCVKFTALDARRDGFATSVIQDACRAVNLHPGDEVRAFKEMEAAGVVLLSAAAVLAK